ncbi:MAG TPA: hypothetical protein VD865_02805 [Stenotrophomonas sp.]|nr:hypothetical protein [Stenotrophomonas sp.]
MSHLSHHQEPPADSLRGLLPDLAERTAAQLLDLHRYPTPERAERLAIELEGIRTLALKLRHALIQEARADG